MKFKSGDMVMRIGDEYSPTSSFTVRIGQVYTVREYDDFACSEIRLMECLGEYSFAEDKFRLVGIWE